MPHAISTRCGARPQAILHPAGNRGADLIETIRLERLSTSLVDKGPHPDSKLFIPAHHTDPRMQPQSSKPGVGGPGAKAWTERKWNRPVSAGQMRVHSRDALSEMLASEGESGAPSDQASRRGSPLPMGKGTASPSPVGAEYLGVASYNSSVAGGPKAPPGGKRRPHSAHTLAEMRQRQRLQEQQAAIQERVMRKLKETQAAAAAQQEEDFQKAWEQFHQEQAGPVAEIEKMLRLKDVEAMRRASAQSKEWNEEVFQRIQAQITRGLRKREASGTYNTRWRAAQDDYLRTLSKKSDTGVFRDIVIEEEYDPLDNANARITYSSAKVNLRDPLKLEQRKYDTEMRMVPGASAAEQETATRKKALCRECFDVKKWTQLEATPYGHFNKVDLSTRKQHPVSTTAQRVLGDHYTRTTIKPNRTRRPPNNAPTPLE